MPQEPVGQGIATPCAICARKKAFSRLGSSMGVGTTAQTSTQRKSGGETRFTWNV